MTLSATVKLPESTWKLVKIEAIKEGCTVSEFVRRCLEAALSGETEQARGQGGR